MFLNQDSNFALSARLTEAVTASQVQVSVTYRDNTDNYHPDAIVATNDTTAVTLLVAPSDGVVNIVETIKIYNPDTKANTVEFLAGDTVIYACTVSSKESLVLSEESFGSVTTTNSGSGGSTSGVSVQICTSTAASAASEKTVALSGFNLSTGATILVTFTHANTADAPTLNVNSTGAVPIISEDGNVCSSSNPAYFPAGSTVEFVYNGTYWVHKKRLITNYVNGTSWYRVWSDGWIEQGDSGCYANAASVTFLKAFRDTNYLVTGNPAGNASQPNPNGQDSTCFVKYATYLGIYSACNMNGTTMYVSWTACGY